MWNMTTVFELTTRPILCLSKLIGVIQLSYTFDSTGLLVQDANSDIYFILELIKLFVLIICTYEIIEEEVFLRYITLIKFWVIFVTSRISEVWIIKYVILQLNINTPID